MAIQTGQEFARKKLLDVFQNKTVCITGATGLIGSAITRAILRGNDEQELNCTVIALVRDEKKAEVLFGGAPSLLYYRWNLQEPFPQIAECVDYVIHTACPTSSASFVESPVETISAILSGTGAMLEFCRKQSLLKVVFLSTMEVYGEIDGVVSEDQFGALDPMNVRNSYPESKRMAECLCASYSSEYDVPCCVLRLAQSFGSGVSRADKRVFAEFANRALEGKPIVLFSDGMKKNAYLSLNDAVSAVFTVCSSGVPGEAYNAANRETYCSILEMAQFVQNSFNTQTEDVVFGEDVDRARAFRKSSNLLLDTKKLETLGWQASENLKTMYTTMMADWQNE